MKGHAGPTILAVILTIHVVNATGAMKVLHFPERIIGGVIDIVQSHKNKPLQPGNFQGQNQQQSQQAYGWNAGYQTQNQNQAQYQYGNYGNPQTGTYPQGGYVNNAQHITPGYQQPQNPGQYQNYPQNQSGNQFQMLNQQSSNHPSTQYQNQAQNGFQGQQTQMQGQNQPLQTQNGQYLQNSQSNMNYQGPPNVMNQQVGHNNVPSGNYGGQPTYGTSDQSGNYYNQGQQSNQYGMVNIPQGQLSQTTSFVGQNHQSTQFQSGSGNYGGSQGFQTTTSPHSPTPGPTCVCQAWTKPQNDGTNENSGQRNEEKTESPLEN